MNRKEILVTASDLVSVDRAEQYGDARQSFNRISDLWSVYLEKPLSVTDVANMMVLLKVSRAKGNPLHEDSYIDMAGYAALAGEMATGEDNGS